LRVLKESDCEKAILIFCVDAESPRGLIRHLKTAN
jgi:hypothetical protein